MNEDLQCSLCYSSVEEVLQLDCPHQLCLICACKIYHPPNLIKCLLCESQTKINIQAQQILAKLAIKHRKSPRQGGSIKKSSRKSSSRVGSIVQGNNNNTSSKKLQQLKQSLSNSSSLAKMSTLSTFSTQKKPSNNTNNNNFNQSTAVKMPVSFHQTPLKKSYNSSQSNLHGSHSPFTQSSKTQFFKPTPKHQKQISQLVSKQKKDQQNSPSKRRSPSTGKIMQKSPKLSRQNSGAKLTPSDLEYSQSVQKQRENSQEIQFLRRRQMQAEEDFQRSLQQKLIEHDIVICKQQQDLQRQMRASNEEYFAGKLSEEILEVQNDLQKQFELEAESERVFRQQVQVGKNNIIQQIDDIKVLLEKKQEQMLQEYEYSYRNMEEYYSQVNLSNKQKAILFDEFQKNVSDNYVQSGMEFNDFMLSEFPRQKQDLYTELQKYDEFNKFNKPRPDDSIIEGNIFDDQLDIVKDQILGISYVNFGTRASTQQGQQQQSTLFTRSNSTNAQRSTQFQESPKRSCLKKSGFIKNINNNNNNKNDFSAHSSVAQTARFELDGQQQQENKLNNSFQAPLTVRSSKKMQQRGLLNTYENSMSPNRAIRSSNDLVIMDTKSFNPMTSKDENWHFTMVQDIKSRQSQSRNSSVFKSSHNGLQSSIIKGGKDTWTSPPHPTSKENHSPVSEAMHFKSYMNGSNKKRQMQVKEMMDDQVFRLDRKKSRSKLNEQLSRSPIRHNKEFGQTSSFETFRRNIGGLSMNTAHHPQRDKSLKDKLGDVKQIWNKSNY